VTNLKKLAVLLVAAAAAASQALVFPSAPFPTAPFWMEDFDSTPAGVYPGLPIFSGWANCVGYGAGGALVVRPSLNPPTLPHMLYGDGKDVRITTSMPMRRFSGWFRQVPFSIPSSTVTFRFYDVSLSPIGTVTVPLTGSWQWYGWATLPKWRRVEIEGNIIGLPGGVAMDSLAMRP
jgi:hypothetical protein